MEFSDISEFKVYRYENKIECSRPEIVRDIFDEEIDLFIKQDAADPFCYSLIIRDNDDESFFRRVLILIPKDIDPLSVIKLSLDDITKRFICSSLMSKV